MTAVGPGDGAVSRRPQPLTGVVCATVTQFEHWCRENGMSPRDPSLRMVTESHHARACWFGSVVDLGEGRPGVLRDALARVRHPETEEENGS